MHAFLITGPKEESLNYCLQVSKKQKAKILPIILQKIDDVRNLRKLVKLSFPEKTAILIENIDSATTETQNAFLKNLEEPQENLIYILTAKNLHNALPTIQSRCEITTIKTKNTAPNTNGKKGVLKQFSKKNIDEKFEIINNIKEREGAVEFVEDLIFFEREQNNFSNMKNYLNTLKNLKANGNISLQLTNMLVSSLR